MGSFVNPVEKLIKEKSMLGEEWTVSDIIREKKWDARFIELANMVSSWSKDPSTKTGAVIVRPDLSVASVGFNGFPKQMEDSKELYEDRDLKLSRVVHAEVNALIHATERVVGYTLYTTPWMPCDRCVVQMIQAGISRFVFLSADAERKERWADAFEKTYSYLNEAEVSYSEYGVTEAPEQL